MAAEARFPIISVLSKAKIPLFGVAGTHIMRVLKEIAKSESEAVYVPARTELSAGFMAIGYGRATGAPAVCLVTPGPGFLLSTPAMLEASLKETPVIFISGQIHRNLRGKGGKALHEFENQLSTAKMIFRHAAFASTPFEADRYLEEALSRCLGPSPQPSYIEIPVEAMTPYGGENSISSPSSGEAGERRIELSMEIGQLLSKCDKPVILAGRGASSPSARESLLPFASSLGAPLFTTISGKGIVPERHPSSGGVYSHQGGGRIFKESDLLIGLGLSYSYLSTGNRRCPLPPALIDINTSQQGPIIPGVEVLHVTSSVEEFFKRFPGNGEKSVWAPHLGTKREEIRRDARRTFPREMGFIEVLEEVVPPDARIFTDPTILSYWMRYFYRSQGGGRYHYPSGSNSLGFALPAAIGAGVGEKRERMVVVTGDGNFPYFGGDLACAKELDGEITILLVKDGGYGVLREWNKWEGEERVGVNLYSPDFRKICAGYGFEYNKVLSATELKASLTEDKAGGSLRFIEIGTHIKPPWSVI